jgi:diphthamide biosynthesis enzyme Dph1/Dph2-like protein
MINQDYDLELAKVVSEIKRRQAKKVLIQLGEGLKPRAIEIQEHIQKEMKQDAPEIFFWLNSCYGKCDIPEILESKNNDIDLLIQFGH